MTRTPSLGVPFGINISYRLERISGGLIELVQVMETGSVVSRSRTTYKYQVDLADLEAPGAVTLDSFAAKYGTAAYRLRLLVRGGRSQVRGEEQEEGKPSTSFRQGFVEVTFEDQSMAERARTAFAHAIALSSGRREPF